MCAGPLAASEIALDRGDAGIALAVLVVAPLREVAEVFTLPRGSDRDPFGKGEQRRAHGRALRRAPSRGGRGHASPHPRFKVASYP